MPSDRATDFDRAANLRGEALRVCLHAMALMDQKATNKLLKYANELEAQAVALDAE